MAATASKKCVTQFFSLSDFEREIWLCNRCSIQNGMGVWVWRPVPGRAALKKKNTDPHRIHLKILQQQSYNLQCLLVETFHWYQFCQTIIFLLILLMIPFAFAILCNAQFGHELSHLFIFFCVRRSPVVTKYFTFGFNLTVHYFGVHRTQIHSLSLTQFNFFFRFFFFFHPSPHLFFCQTIQMI